MRIAPRPLVYATRLQLGLSRRDPQHLLVLVTTPLLSLIFMSISRSLHRQIDVSTAVVAPGLMGLWYAALDMSGVMISLDRWQGRLELLMAAPAGLAEVVFGRVLVITSIGSVTFGEAWLVASLFRGGPLPIAQPPLFIAVLALSALAMTATAALIGAFFTLSRVKYIIFSSLTYPVYILSGVLVPVTALPEWLRPVSRVIFLTYSADLLRAAGTGRPGEFGRATGVVLLILLTFVAAALSAHLMRIIVERLRENGTVHQS
jgi:ABC-2 type transport system permease protein